MHPTLLCEVRIGEYTDHAAIFHDLERAGFGWCNWGEDILRKVPLDGERQVESLFVVTNEELGLPGGAYYRDVTEPDNTTVGRALKSGYRIISGEVAPALLIQHSQGIERVVEEGLAIGMEAIAAPCSWLSILNLHKKLVNTHQPILSATRAGWHFGDYRFMFAR